MKSGSLLAILIALATGVLVVMGVLWPNEAGAGVTKATGWMNVSDTTPVGAANRLLQQIARHDWDAAYASLANKSQFTEQQFENDLLGVNGSLRTYAMLDTFDSNPLQASADEANIRANLHWATVVGNFSETRDLHEVRSGNQWRVAWPIVRQPRVPPQVIPVNYLRWDVIYRGAADDWGAQDVESPHVRIVAMHPIERAGEVVVMGEILNEDVVPAYVTVNATLLDKKGTSIASEDSFDKISHVLLPKQVSPFRIDFPHTRMSQVDSVRVQPSSNLVPASADPVIGIEDQKLNPVPDSSLSGTLVNQSGQTVNVAHVLATFYDDNGRIIWIADQYPSNALLPKEPVPFSIDLPADISSKIKNYRVTTSTYTSSRFQ